MKKLLFIINPKAGLKKKKTFVDEAVEAFEKAGYKVGIKYTKKRADGTEIAREYGSKVDLVVCMGGDGTLNEVMEGLIEGNVETPLGYIPAGSTNDFASSLGLKSDPKEAAEYIVSNEARKLDLGEFNGRYFVYTASAGVFTKTSYATSQKLKNRLGHMAYILSAFKELFHLKKLKVKVELEDSTIVGEYIFMAINNSTKVGGVMKLDKEKVKFNDGVFELMLVDFPRNPIQFFKIVRKVLKQDFTGDIVFKQIKSARISDCSDIDWSLDGEEQKGQEVVDFRVVHNAIRFIY